MTITELENLLGKSDVDHTSEECQAFDRLIHADLMALECIRSVESTWRTELREQRIAFDSIFDRLIVRKYEAWLELATRRLRQLDIQVNAESLTEAAEFRRQVAEVSENLIMRARYDGALEVRAEMLKSEPE